MPIDKNSEKTLYSEKISKTKLPWQIYLFLFSLLVPTEASFSIGNFRLSPYRVSLLCLFVPCFLKVFTGKSGKSIPADWLFLGYGLWMVLSLGLNHGTSVGLESGGILMVESLGAYLVARSFITNRAEFVTLVRFLILIVIGLSFVTIPESLTGINILRPKIGHIDPRLGLERAFGPFDHPILYGVFCASITSLAFYVNTGNVAWMSSNKLKAGWVVIATFLSLSSGALAAVMVQLILSGWDKITRGLNARWRIFTFLILIGYIFIDLFSNRTPIKVILHRLTFSAHTAYNRLIIWEWGTKYNVAQNPWFGIGFSDWVRPSWMHSTSMDNFWLVNMVRYGLPSFVLLSAGVLLLLISTNRINGLDKTAVRLRTGWLFSIIGLIIGGCTVHFWNSLYVWFFFILGSGAWMSLENVNEHCNEK